MHTRAVRVLEAELEAGVAAVDSWRTSPPPAARSPTCSSWSNPASSTSAISHRAISPRGCPRSACSTFRSLLTDRERTRALLQGALGERLAAEVAPRTGYRVLGFWDNGPRNISNRLRPIRMPDDCEGIRIRTLPSAGHHATYRALGMEPVTIDIRDFVEAIASGKVDAQENPLTNVRQFGLQKYHRHVTITAHFQGIALLLCNAKMLGGSHAAVSRGAVRCRRQGDAGAMGLRRAGRAGIAHRARGRRRRHRRSRRRRPGRVPRRGAPAGRAANGGVAAGPDGAAQRLGNRRAQPRVNTPDAPSGASTCAKPRYRRGPGFRFMAPASARCA